MLCLLLFALSLPVELLEKKTLSQIEAVDRKLSGVMGLAALDLTSGRMLTYHADTIFAQASSIKIPIMMRVFELVEIGKLRLDQELTVQPSESVGGSGHLQGLLKQGSLKLTLHEAVTAMIGTSDNTATNKLIALVGMESVNAMLDRIGFAQTRLQRIMLDGPAARRGNENVSTPREMVRLMEVVRNKPELIAILKLVKASFRSSIPAAVPVAAKPGNVPGVHCETGIVYLESRPFALSVMLGYAGADANPIPALAKIVFEHFEKVGKSNDFGHTVD